LGPGWRAGVLEAKNPSAQKMLAEARTHLEAALDLLTNTEGGEELATVVEQQIANLEHLEREHPQDG
jgi:hypothetical protein